MKNKIICIVDNASKQGSQLETEHGVAFWIETEHGICLFDTGQSARALARNLSAMNLDPKEVDAVAISHAHYDHTGGLEAVLGKNPDLVLYANADVFRHKFSLHDGVYEASGFEFSREHYEKQAVVRLNSEPVEIFSNLRTTGEITERNEPEGRSAAHHIREKGKFIPDPYRDDMSLVLKTDEGLVLICGCCHAGILNTLTHVGSHFGDPIIAVLGGIHLMSADKPLLRQVVEALKKYDSLSKFCLNHCTGDDTLEVLRNAFDDCVEHFTAGCVIEF